MPKPPTRTRLWLRLLGLVLLVVLIWRLDTTEIVHALSRVDPLALVAIALLNIPMVLLKSFRWQIVMRSQRIFYNVVPAFLAYFGSIFIGLLTPGRMGEFVKALHVSQDRGVSSGEAFSSVLLDRLFDLYALLLVGGFALWYLPVGEQVNRVLILALSVALAVGPLLLFLHEQTFELIRSQGARFGRAGRKLFGPDGWVIELRRGVQKLQMPWLVVGIALTIAAYLIFFGQCYLIALALDLQVSFMYTSFAVAVGSLVTLIPISISGLGTREAAVVVYLGTLGVPSEVALTFSLLVFAVFYLAGGVMGAIAWWIKPLQVRLSELGR